MVLLFDLCEWRLEKDLVVREYARAAVRLWLIFNAADAVAHKFIYCSAATDLLALRPGEGVLESAHLVQLYSASRRGRRAVVLINSRCVLLPFIDA